MKAGFTGVLANRIRHVASIVSLCLTAVVGSYFHPVGLATNWSHDFPPVETAVALRAPPQTYLDEEAFLNALIDSGCGKIHEGFEGTAWDVARSPTTAASVTHQGITWTSNNDISKVTTGGGPARTGNYGFFTLPHGNFATGTDCHLPGNCTDGFIGTSGRDLCGVGAWINGNFGKIELILDGDAANPIDFGDDAGVNNLHKFFGVVVPNGFRSFEVHETEGTLEDQKFIFADDFTFGTRDFRIFIADEAGME